MKKILMAAALAVSTACAAHAQNVMGDWQGALKAGRAELRIRLHITDVDYPRFTATLDSLDQQAMGLRVSSGTLDGSKLRFTVADLHVTYQGSANAGGTAIEGKWSEGMPLPLIFKRITVTKNADSKPAKPSDVDGAWLGALELDSGKLRIVFHITNTEDGLIATMDSLDENMKELPASMILRKGSSLKLEFNRTGALYEGKFDKGLTTLDGAWMQGGGNLPLVLKRVRDAADFNTRSELETHQIGLRSIRKAG